MRVLSTAVTLWALFSVRYALACPSCEPGRQARAALWERGDFWLELVLITLPLILIGLLAFSLHGRAARSDER